jgi:hypothetical protein
MRLHHGAVDTLNPLQVNYLTRPYRSNPQAPAGYIYMILIFFKATLRYCGRVSTTTTGPALMTSHRPQYGSNKAILSRRCSDCW